MNFNRSEDQAGFFGTIVFHALLVFLLFMLMTCDNEPPIDPLDGAVSVSLGEPDYGGPDNSTAEATEATPQPTEAQAEEQITSDDADAPEVQETTTTPTTTTTTPTDDKPDRKPNSDDLFKPKKPGDGGGSGDGDTPGDQGQPDGVDGGSPDGTGTGTQGTGFSGDGYSGNINGFKVTAPHKPVNTQQQFGKVTVIVCVDIKGNVISVRSGGKPTTNTSKHLENLSIRSAKMFKFERIGQATQNNCGYITFNYKAG